MTNERKFWVLGKLVERWPSNANDISSVLLTFSWVLRVLGDVWKTGWYRSCSRIRKVWCFFRCVVGGRWCRRHDRLSISLSEEKESLSLNRILGNEALIKNGSRAGVIDIALAFEFHFRLDFFRLIGASMLVLYSEEISPLVLVSPNSEIYLIWLGLVFLNFFSFTFSSIKWST